MAQSITNWLSGVLGFGQFYIKSSSLGMVTLSGINISRVLFHLESKLLSNVKEDGTTIIDARVIEPTRIDIELIATTIGGIENINRLLRNRDAVFEVFSKGVLARNMMLAQENIAQHPDVISASPMQITFSQILVKDSIPVTCLQQSDSSVIESGIIAIGDATRSVTDFASNAIRDIF